MGELVVFDGPTLRDTPPDRVLDSAKDAELSTVFVIGERDDGEPYFAGSTSDIGRALVLFEKFKKQVF